MKGMLVGQNMGTSRREWVPKSKSSLQQKGLPMKVCQAQQDAMHAGQLAVTRCFATQLTSKGDGRVTRSEV